jgi:L-gulonolactone oxidase
VRWSTWSGAVAADPVAIEQPSTEDQVVAIVHAAADLGLRVKAVGSGHSFPPIAVTDGVMLRMERLAGIVDVDLAAMRVVVRAGTVLGDLNRALFARGLALPNLGDIDRQTISGAVATGTHGTGAGFRGIADAVVGLRLVLADGTVADCDAAREPALFHAARIGLGAFGVVTELTLQCVPAFLLHAQEEPDSLGRVLDSIDEVLESADHVEFYWFPHTDRVLVKRNARRSLSGGLDPLPRWRARLDDDLLANRVFEVVNRVAAARPSWIPRINAVSSRALSAREFTQPSFEVFASERTVRFNEMEYAIPREALPPVMRDLQALADGLRVAFPVEVRVAEADDLWLSTASGRPTAYVAVHEYHRRDHREYFDAFEAVARAADGRPHWGKWHSRSAEDLQPAYPHLTDAIAVRDRVDPDRRFANAYLDRVLGP